MKRYAAAVVVLAVLALSAANLLAVHTTAAQDSSEMITLNDATPAIDVQITPVPGTSGTVALELVQASIKVTDSAGYIVFQMADPRVHRLELRMAPGTNGYTLSAERLPGIAQAYVRVISQPDLTDSAKLGGTILVSNPQQPLGFQQSMNLPLTNATPSQTADFSIPANTKGTMKVSFPNTPVTTQVTDSTGQTIATLRGSTIDGLSMVLDGGQYKLSLLNTNLQQETTASMEIMPAIASSLDNMAAQPVSNSQQTAAAMCNLTVGVASVNLRSGPGTGYSVIDYGFRNDQFPVGGKNSDGSWLVIATPKGGSAWVARSTAGALNGSCQNLTVYDIPYRGAPAQQQIIVQQPPVIMGAPAAAVPPAAPPASSGGGGYSDDGGGEHEGGD